MRVQTGVVIPVDLALRLREAGVRWTPVAGDRFVVPHRGMDDEVFVLSTMTIEVHNFPTGPVIGFNGTVEWALDSIEKDDVVWLPREDQLRELLAGRFLRLEADPQGYAVVVDSSGQERRTVDPDVETAYARSLLGLLEPGRR